MLELEHFIGHLSTVDNLYCGVLLEEKRCICRSKKTSLETWNLSCTNAVDSFWELELDADKVFQHKKSTGFQEGENFREYFELFRKAFKDDSVSIQCLPNNTKELIMIVQCTFENERKPIFYKFKLPFYTGKDFSQRLCKFTFELFEDLRGCSERLFKALKERDLFGASANNFHEATNSEFFGVGNFGSSNKLTSLNQHGNHCHCLECCSISKKPSAQKRKPGYSLINPNSKRYIARGAKIE